MNTAFRQSLIRASVGGGLILLGLLGALFVLPSASEARNKQLDARKRAEKDLEQQQNTLKESQASWDRYRRNREIVEALEQQLAGATPADPAAPKAEGEIPDGADSGKTPAADSPKPPPGVGELQWLLSRKLYDLAQKHGVRIISVKYGLPNRESTKGTDLEALDVEFASLGVFSSLKPFMLALEGSDLPFAVVTAKLEESPEGARLSAVLRAFRKSSTPASSRTGEDA